MPTVLRSGWPTRSNGAQSFHLLSLILTVFYVVFVAYLWLFADKGHAVPPDFLSRWAEGRLSLEGNAPAAYDSVRVHQAEIEGAGISLGVASAYPPTFLLISVPLALLPYATALLLWLSLTLFAYVVTIRGIVGRLEAALTAVAFPAALWNFWTGQTGFLTASLIGGALLFAESRPLLAGACLGLLTIKPQFGLLFPIVLIAAGRWQVFRAATAVALSLAATSWLAFGSATWAAFLHAAGVVGHDAFATVFAAAGKLQSVYGFVRGVGGSNSLAWLLHGLVAAATAVGVCWLWRRKLPYDLKAAALAAGSLLISPYVFVYDMAILGVAIAFLMRAALATGFLRHEGPLLAGAALVILLFPFVAFPVVVVALLVVIFSIVRRIVVATPHC